MPNQNEMKTQLHVPSSSAPAFVPRPKYKGKARVVGGAKQGHSADGNLLGLGGGALRWRDVDLPLVDVTHHLLQLAPQPPPHQPANYAVSTRKQPHLDSRQNSFPQINPTLIHKQVQFTACMSGHAVAGGYKPISISKGSESGPQTSKIKKINKRLGQVHRKCGACADMRGWMQGGLAWRSRRCWCGSPIP